MDYAAKTYKDKIAFRYRVGEAVIDVTFNQFKSDVFAFMAYLFKNGIKDGQRVALLGENSYEWIVTYFATVNCGNIIVPIDKELKPNEISTLLNDSESVLLCPGSGSRRNNRVRLDIKQQIDKNNRDKRHTNNVFRDLFASKRR